MRYIHYVIASASVLAACADSRSDDGTPCEGDQCASDDGAGTDGKSDETTCPISFEYVCGVNGNTFPNACEAETSGYRIVGDGPC